MDHPLVIIALLAVALAAACLRPGIHEPARAETAPLPIQPHEDLRLPTALPWVPRPDLSAPRAVVSGELSGSCDALEEPGEWDTGQVEHGEELHAPVILGAMDRSLVAAAIAADSDRLQACWERATPGSEGELVMLRLVIDASGTVLHTEVESSSRSEPATEACLAGRTLSLRFPSTCGGMNIVTWPFPRPVGEGEVSG